ncbi:carbonic anhydrase 15 [Drosophila grimshawi]|uniref:Carbonic anhydrase n=1 Tax=Drosophila grimshawi TaxID=7222 RepID=B4JTY5_DROGR|nr:carbonic anhydrase 15 [Drosophila grimshawi]EDV91564.1 GH17509 [Drosophila grimshawi]
MHFPAIGDFYQRLLFLLPFSANLLPEGLRFSYDEPQKWQYSYPQCGGSEQSPIALNPHKVIPIGLPPLYFGLYDEPFDELLSIRNNGHTVEFGVPPTVFGERPYLTGGLLSDFYEAMAVHFHWGSSQSKGSEHLINGRRYDLEMHIVHRNTKYQSDEEARNQTDGIAVLAVLFKVVKTDYLYYQPGLNEIFGSLLHLGEFNNSYTPAAFLTLGSLLGNLDRGNFYAYKGSLTTPPCSPAVLWHVFAEVLPISHRELPKFWQLRDRLGRPLLNTFRPLQSVEARQVFQRRPIVEYAWL